MKQKLLNSIRLRVCMLVAVMCAAFAGQAWADTKTEGFEGKTAGSNYQGTVTVSTSESDCGIGWEMYYGTVSTSSKISGSNSAALRLYSSSNNLGYLKTTTPIEGLSNVSFKAKASTSNSAKIKVNVDYSIDGSSWTTIASNQLFSSSASTYNFNIPSGGKYFRLIITSSSTKPTSGNAQLTIDDVVFTYTPAAALSSIALSGTYPNTFHQGDAFSHEGMIVTATYADDSQADVTASASFSGYNMSSTGVQTVTVSYTENEVTKTATYDITVNTPATLTSIALSGTYPTEFDYGAAFSSEGIVVTANYDDETNKIVTGDATFSGYNMTSAGAQTVTVSYTENEVTKTTTYEITVNAYVQPTSVTVNMNYAWLGSSNGSNISADKLPVVKAQDNVQITITDGTSTHPRGDANYIRVYVGSTMTFEAPSGYDITGIVFTTGGSGTWNAPNVNSGTLSSQTWSGTASSVTFTMTGSCFISSAAITLAKQKELSSIAVSGTYPTEFEVGDEFSHEGAVVTATYDDASEAVVTGSAVFSTPDMSSAGVKTITVSYTENAVEKTTTYDITVTAPADLTSIALSGTYPTTFNVGDDFSHEGMTVTATFADESNADVTGQATFTGYNMSEAGVQTVTVSYTYKTSTTRTKTYDITVNTVAVTGVTVAPASATVKIGKTVTLTPTVNPGNATNKNVTWESSNTSIATVDNGVVTGVATGEATITVKSAADPTKSASCTVTVIAAGDGSKANPYDVDEALEIISEYSSGSGSDGNVYTKGVVSSVGSLYNSTMLTYFISIDGTNENTIQVFRGKNLGNSNFASTSDIKVNDEVIVYGQLYKYNTTPEINTGNYIYSLNGVKIPEITFGQASYEVLYNGSLTITATADCSGAITYSSSDETVAEINETTGVVTPHKAGEVTITANVAASGDNIAGSKEVTLTVTDGRTPAGIAFAEASVTKTWGEDFTGQDLTNPNSLDVNYESSAPAVATVNASGVVTIVKAGTTTITATFAGDGDYMPAEVSYTLIVNKAAAGLSFSETAFDIDLNDDSFVAPTLNNPNSLTVTYTSSNESIAVVDENTGELLLDTSAEGTATITASFTENDWYNAGNASYTITIVDPDRKGSKKNPYTVAEVNSGSYSSYNYVKGYIVGCFVGKDSNAASTGSSNVALSDSPSEISGANTIAVQLPAGAIRNAWNIDDNDVIGYEVIVYGNITGYFTGKTGVKSTSEVSAVSVPVTVGAAGYTTITTKYPVSFDGTDVTAYKATAVNPTTIHLEAIDEAPAGEALVIKASAGLHTDIPVIPSAAEINDNILLSSDGSVTGDGSIYALGVGKSGVNKGVVGFYLVNDGQTIPAGKAYLNTGGLVKEFLTFDFDDATAVGEVKNEGVNSEKSIFNLAGQKMSKLQKGVNIVNGKKVLVK